MLLAVAVPEAAAAVLNWEDEAKGRGLGDYIFSISFSFAAFISASSSISPSF